MRFLMILLFVGIVSIGFGADFSEAEIINLLDSAKSFDKHHDYTAKSEAMGNNELIIKNKIMPDGESILRLEIGSHITLHYNNGDTLRLYDNKKTALKNFTLSKYPDLREFQTYSIAEVEYRNIPCYVVKEQLIYSDKLATVIRKYQKTCSETARNMDAKDFMEKMINWLKVYHIGKNDNFIYKEENFNFHGGLKGEIAYYDVNLNPQLSPEEFIVPSEYKMLIPDSEAEETKMELAMLNPTITDYQSKSNSYSNLKFIIITAIGVVVIAIAGILFSTTYTTESAVKESYFTEVQNILQINQGETYICPNIRFCEYF